MLMPAPVGPHSPFLSVTIPLNVAGICWFLNSGPFVAFLKPGITSMVPDEIEYPALESVQKCFFQVWTSQDSTL